MSILIRGIEMPKSCEKCPCKTANAFGGLGCQATGYIQLREANQDRPDNCPLVPILPYGRLIDADTLEMNYLYIRDDGMKIYIQRAIDNAPTILEAEGVKMIYLTSDLHFNHDREFIYKPRGFNSVEEMNNTIITNFNETIAPNDDVYILGDLMLGGPDKLDDGLNLISELNGNLHLVRGNHDTDKRWFMYSVLPNVVECENAIYFKYKGFHLYMSHYPTFTANLEKESLRQCTINLYGHTHQHSNFYNDIPFMYHVGLDSHNNCPIFIDEIINDIYKKVEECREQL